MKLTSCQDPHFRPSTHVAVKTVMGVGHDIG